MTKERWGHALQEFQPAWSALPGVRAPFVGEGGRGGVVALGAKVTGLTRPWTDEAVDVAWLPAAQWVMREWLGRTRLMRLPAARPADAVPIVAPPGLASLDGASFGLPFLVSQLERALGVQARSSLAATGAVDASGAVLPIDGLEGKIRALLEVSSDPLTLLVPEGNLREATALLNELSADRAAHAAMLALKGHEARLGSAVSGLLGRWSHAGPGTHRIVAVRHARELLGLLAPEAVTVRVSAEAAAELLRASFEREPPTGGWMNFRDAVEARLGEADPALRSMLDAALAVAQRHTGGASRVLPAIDERTAGGLTRRARRIALAHRLQSCADGADDAELDRALAEAIAVAAYPANGAPDWDEADFRLAGAIGRAYASRLELDSALLWQLRALEGWREVGAAAARSGDLSYPLCEVLRLAGALGRRDVLDGVGDDLETIQLHGTQVGQGHVRYDRARAAVLLGEADAAARVVGLEGLDVSKHARLAARCHPAQAEALRRAALEAASPKARMALGLLLRLEAAADAAVLEPEAARALLEEAATSEKQQLGRGARIARAGRGPVEALRFLVRGYSY